jgi:hypothetical protein
MKAGAKLDDSGFKMKVRQLKQLDKMFKQLPSHYANFFKRNMVDWELNYGLDNEHIGRISHNLADSVGVADFPYGATVIINKTGIAPYAGYVNNWTKANYGDFIIGLAYKRLNKEMMHLVRVEFHRAANNIESGKSYIYRNPFYS